MPTHPPARTSLRLIAVLTALLLVATACGDDSSSDSASGAGADSITVYSGRSEDLIQPLLDSFTAATGISVEPRFGDSAELAERASDEELHRPL